MEVLIIIPQGSYEDNSIHRMSSFRVGEPDG
jgi:hypothetical protein